MKPGSGRYMGLNAWKAGMKKMNVVYICVLLGISGVADLKMSMEFEKIFLESVWKKHRVMSERGIIEVQLRKFECYTTRV